MKPLQTGSIPVRFIAAFMTVLVICGVAAVGVIIFLRVGKGTNWTTEKAHQLTNIELTQLIGTKSYEKNDTSSHSSVFTSVVQRLKPAIPNPLTMLTDQLPLTTSQALHRSQTESSLFRSITSFASSTGKIAMGWIPSTTAASCIAMLKSNPGINVASPVWFHLADASGNISGHALPTVVRYAHNRNIKVWVMVDNHFNASLTHQVLANPKAATNLADELAYQAKIFHLDGINVDFENVAATDRTAFTQFLKMLHQKLSAEKVDLSVDISPDIVPLRDNAAFFHAGISNIADQVILMAYDEHWSGDQSPGPVADLPWVKQSVYDLLNTGVPTDKLILGMPFYTRFWYVHKNGHITDQAVSDGHIQEILKKHHATGAFNQTLDLMYVRYTEPDGYMEAWYPNTQTLHDKFSLIGDNGLAGVAVWSLELSDRKTWSTMLSTLKHAISS